jgi:hypothetical protein
MQHHNTKDEIDHTTGEVASAPDGDAALPQGNMAPSRVHGVSAAPQAMSDTFRALWYPPTDLPDTLVPIPNYPDYAICSREYDVWRVNPGTRGTYAYRAHKLRPFKHPRGTSYRVNMTDEDGRKGTVHLPRLIFVVFGVRQSRFGEIPE